MHRLRALPAAVLGRIGRRAGLDDNQTYTVATGIVLALVLAVIGLPPVLRGVDELAAPIPVDDSTATTTTTVPEPTTTTSPRSLGSGGGSGPVAPIVAPVDGTPVDPEAPVPDTAWFASLDVGPPRPVAVDADGSVWVGTDNTDTVGSPGPSVLVRYDSVGRATGRWILSGQQVARSAGITAISPSPDGTLLVLDAAGARLLRFDPSTETFDDVATIPDLGSCFPLGLLVGGPCETALFSTPPLASDLAIAGDDVYVADRNQGWLWRLAGDTFEPVLEFTERASGGGPDALLARDGHLWVALSGRTGAVPPGSPSLVTLPLDGATTGVGALDGLTRTVVTDLPTAVGDLAFDADGTLLASLPGEGRVVRIAASAGLPIAAGATVDDIDPAEGAPGFRAPWGLALATAGTRSGTPELVITDAYDLASTGDASTETTDAAVGPWYLHRVPGRPTTPEER